MNSVPNSDRPTPLSVLPATLWEYFESFNSENFEITASLFAEDGALRPPFDPAIVGREAIASYLDKEARGMHLTPLRCTSTTLENGNTEHTVVGKARTPFFSVNISWLFITNTQSEITFTGIKLLASLGELLNLKNLSQKEGKAVA